MDLQRYVSIARRWWWVLVAGMIGCAALGFLFSRMQTPVYAATSTLLVNQASTGDAVSFNDALANQQLAKTYSRLVTSPPVLERVARGLNLDYDRLQASVSALASRETQLIDVTAEDSRPDRAAQIADRVAIATSEHVYRMQQESLTGATSGLQQRIAAVQASIRDEQEVLRRITTEPAERGEAERQQRLAETQARLATYREDLTALQRRLQDVQLRVTLDSADIALVAPAREPNAPIRPRTMLNTVLGGMLGLMLAGGLVMLREHFDDRLRTAVEAADLSGMPVLGAIGQFGSRLSFSVRQHNPPRLLNGTRADRAAAEAYRLTCARLELVRRGLPNARALLVTSAVRGEGKSTTAANLAVALAQSGQRVILVDADLRAPVLHQMFDLPNTPGFTTLLALDAFMAEGKIDASTVLHETRVDNLWLLASGVSPTNPTSLLSSSRVKKVVEALRDAADIVLFDSPPMLDVADTMTLAAHLDCAVLVAAPDRTHRADLEQVVEALQLARIAPLGIVLNRHEPANGRRGDRQYKQMPTEETAQPVLRDVSA